MRLSQKVAAAFLLSGVCLLASSAHAQSVRDESARASFHRMLSTYRALNSFSCSITEETKIAKVTRIVRGQLSYRKPRQVVWSREGGFNYVSNGKEHFMYLPRPGKNRYSKITLPDSQYGEAALMESKPGGYFFAPILLGLNPYVAPWGRAPKSISRGASEIIDGANVEIISVERPNESGRERIHYAIGRDDHLLRRIVYDWRDKKSTHLMTFTFTEIKANPVLPDALFVWKPPPGATEETMETSEHFRWNKRLKIGGAPIPISASDLNGKAISLGDYKGKVLLIDFWATWCGPCVEEIPHLKTAYQKYRPQGFEILSISFDFERAKLEAYVNNHNMPWPQIFHVKNWKQPINQEYKVNSIPMTILIGRDGKIAAIGERALSLDQAIHTALAK